MSNDAFSFYSPIHFPFVDAVRTHGVQCFANAFTCDYPSHSHARGCFGADLYANAAHADVDPANSWQGFATIG